MAERVKRTVTLVITVEVPVDWTDADVNDALQFQLDVSNLNDQDVDWSAMDVKRARLAGAPLTTPTALRLMPQHRIYGEDDEPVCRASYVSGYVHVLPNGDLHCNRCGWVSHG